MKKFGIIAVLLINLAGLCLAVNYSLATNNSLQLIIAGGIAVLILVVEMIFIEKMGDSYSPVPYFTGVLTIMTLLLLGVVLSANPENEFEIHVANFLAYPLYACCGSAIPLTIAGLLSKE